MAAQRSITPLTDRRTGHDRDAARFDLTAALNGISEIEDRMTTLSAGLEDLEHLEWSKSARRLCDLTASLRRKIHYRMTEKQVMAAGALQGYG